MAGPAAAAAGAIGRMHHIPQRCQTLESEQPPPSSGG
jgi:hypothetical protein